VRSALPRRFLCLLHVLFRKVYQHGSRSIASTVFCRVAHVWVDLELGGIRRIIEIREANVHWQRWITHKHGSARHVRVLVNVRVQVGKEFVLALFQQQRRLCRRDATVGVKTRTKCGRLLVEYVTTNRPREQIFERVSVQSCDLRKEKRVRKGESIRIFQIERITVLRDHRRTIATMPLLQVVKSRSISGFSSNGGLHCCSTALVLSIENAFCGRNRKSRMP